ncbi:hypothetical protein B5M47_02510 [candidate division CPR3 bacterium 4484_211]|uniref:Dinitrogenase iron-molybdenum cofactor biosynthesis domain-containing protein n=1 Tax=candidate division CPR3 bacterium 4484_211 TaxID=1968527 RepID=A0A1W9NY01_UNCC3|nr:MAG: hypothetical protein B5M47_02510 [candidate division CPR3 bacterium 4484_211]
MKLAISSTGKDLNSLVDSRFGRCPYLLVVDTETKDWQAADNVSAQSARGAGVGTAQKVIDLGCSAVVSGNMGPNACRVLQSAGIKIYTGAFGITVAQALKDYNEGRLTELKDVPPGRGCGLGGRWGRGRGRGR